MLNNSQLIDILGLLGLNYYVEDGRTIIIDTNNEDATYIERDKNGYKFTIGDITCHFNNLSVQLDINDKRLVFVGRNIGYQRKLPNSSYNATSFRRCYLLLW